MRTLILIAALLGGCDNSPSAVNPGPDGGASDGPAGTGPDGAGGGPADMALALTTTCATTPLADLPLAMDWDPTAKLMWVATGKGVFTVDADNHVTQVTNMAFGDIAVAPGAGKVYATTFGGPDAKLQVIDAAKKTLKNVVTVAGAGNANWVAVDPTTNLVFAYTDDFFAQAGASQIVMLKAADDSVVAQVPAGVNGFAGVGKQISVDATHGKVWVIGGRNGTPVVAVEVDEETKARTPTMVSATGNAHSITAVPTMAKSNAVAMVYDAKNAAVSAYLVDFVPLPIQGIVPWNVIPAFDGTLIFLGMTPTNDPALQVYDPASGKAATPIALAAEVANACMIIGPALAVAQSKLQGMRIWYGYAPLPTCSGGDQPPAKIVDEQYVPPDLRASVTKDCSKL